MRLMKFKYFTDRQLYSKHPAKKRTPIIAALFPYVKEKKCPLCRIYSSIIVLF